MACLCMWYKKKNVSASLNQRWSPLSSVSAVQFTPETFPNLRFLPSVSFEPKLKSTSAYKWCSMDNRFNHPFLSVVNFTTNIQCKIYHRGVKKKTLRYGCQNQIRKWIKTNTTLQFAHTGRDRVVGIKNETSYFFLMSWNVFLWRHIPTWFIPRIPQQFSNS